MWLLVTVAESILLIFGSLLCAILLCLAAWRLMRPVHHPEFAAFFIGALTILAVTMPIGHSPFLRMVMLFAAIGAVPLWIMGRQWRANERLKHRHHHGPGAI
ncbi:hypothetical protein LWE61_13405 [Sphingobium sufflavum]|uniref:hypothetical protein n=1 Tax=Sphingobium sufflavum TaxID=1129547 RepID=UPI001F3649C6|nr:hypothetical protein [Sphingobium sufflavum]MCE7797544.1 hypothetical protein [Sphingobium sufflavum]